MRRILIPLAPGILCAEGLIVSDLQENYVTTCRCPLDGGMETISAAIGKLSSEAEHWLAAPIDNVTDRRQTVFLDLRYIGQNYELPVEVGSGRHVPALPDIEHLKQLFFAEHENAYGHFDPGAPVEVVNVRVRAEMSLAKHSATVERPLEMPSPVTWSDVWFSEEESLSTPVYARDKLPEGALLEGPALITQFDSTTLVPPRWSLRVDAAMNMIMERNNG